MFRNLLNPDNGLMITMNQITDCIFLSLFWLLGCMPVFTAGASCAALYDSVYRRFRLGEQRSWSRFFSSFTRDLKASLLPNVLFVAALWFGIKGLIALWNAAVYGQISWPLFSALTFLAVTVLGMLSVLFPLLSRFDNPLPLLLKNGQTIGKKAFGLGLVRVDCVAITPLQLFCRTLLGKYTLETMIPVYTGFMIFMGSAGMFGLLLIAGLLLAQVILFCASYNHNQIHDLIAGTVVVDVKSQMIFPTVDDRIKYQKQAAAEEADRSPY